MAEVVARNEPFLHEFAPREKSLEEFERDGDFMKPTSSPGSLSPAPRFSFYRNASLWTFAAARMWPSTGRVKAVKVTGLAGAYWLGDEKNPQFATHLWHGILLEEDLDAHFARLERSGPPRPSRAGQAT